MAKTVAVIGASSNRHKFGNKALRAFEHQGYRVIPINPTRAEVEGHKAYASVLDVPGPIDMATVYVPADARRAGDGRAGEEGGRRSLAQPGRRRRRGRRARAGARAEDHPGLQHHRHRGGPGSTERLSVTWSSGPTLAPASRPFRTDVPLSRRRVPDHSDY